MKFTSQASAQNRGVNRSVTLNCTVTGSEPITYQWFKNGSEIPGETEDMLILNPVQFDDFGSYHCTANNSVNTIQSDKAVVTGNHSMTYSHAWVIRT